ncbi:MAG: FAD binding domain-containing protein [Bacteroidota bacterium]
MEFILNKEKIKITGPAGKTVLDFVRYDQDLRGTKIGCREGDCGACTVLVGSLKNGSVQYQSMTSCLTPLANAAGKHIVTVEGINAEALTPVQKAIVEEGGTQCGFCTIGFVMSLTGFCLDQSKTTYQDALAAMDGNICRCTGYKSLERAAHEISNAFSKSTPEDYLNWLVNEGYVPSYFLNIKTRLNVINEKIKEATKVVRHSIIVGGGTDLYVQRPEEMAKATIQSLFDHYLLNGIERQNGHITIGASATAEDINQSEAIKSVIPSLNAYMKLVSSTPIRNMGTLAGNLVNASPIGDLTIFFLALNSKLILNQNEEKRAVSLSEFYKGYKQIDLQKGERVDSLYFEVPDQSSYFNFEKVCKRTHLDIASVNSACQIKVENGIIAKAHLSAGGVAPVPKFLANASKALEDQAVTPETLKKVNSIIQEEVSPISDARGSADYKRLLLRQLFYAHFLKWFPDSISLKSLTNISE